MEIRFGKIYIGHMRKACELARDKFLDTARLQAAKVEHPDAQRMIWESAMRAASLLTMDECLKDTDVVFFLMWCAHRDAHKNDKDNPPMSEEALIEWIMSNGVDIENNIQHILFKSGFSNVDGEIEKATEDQPEGKQETPKTTQSPDTSGT